MQAAFSRTSEQPCPSAAALDATPQAVEIPGSPQPLEPRDSGTAGEGAATATLLLMTGEYTSRVPLSHSLKPPNRDPTQLQRFSRMQGAVARAAFVHRGKYGCQAAPRVLAPRSLSGGGGGGRWSTTAAATGERARAVAAVARGEPRPGDVPTEGEAMHGHVAAAEAAGAPPSRVEKRGSVSGAVALIVGTSIGSGILAVPQRTAPAGFIPSATCMITCWAFLVAEALLLVEINVHLRRKRGKDDGGGGGGDLEVISVKSMAQETLGEWGGNVATAAYLFLSYTSMVAYASKSGEVLGRLTGAPEPVSGAAFTAAVALLIAVGGTGVTDRVNQLLTFVMIGLLLAIEVSAVAFGGGLSLPANANWGQVPATLPVIIFTLVFHDTAPVICAYLGGDLARIRLSIIVGSLVPLLSLLVWDDIALGLATDLDGFDILDMLKTDWSYTVVETFSLLAVGTSLIGTLLGASQFFIEQMTNLASSAAKEHAPKINKGIVVSPIEAGSSQRLGMEKILESKRLSYIATAIVVVPTMIIAATLPNSFSIATDIAGGYCMTILYGVLPPLMAWTIRSKQSDPSAGFVREDVDPSKDDKGAVDFTTAKPVLVGMGVFSVLMVLEQMFQDLDLSSRLIELNGSTWQTWSVTEESRERRRQQLVPHLPPASTSAATRAGDTAEQGYQAAAGRGAKASVCACAVTGIAGLKATADCQGHTGRGPWAGFYAGLWADRRSESGINHVDV
ncbi:hypothetical protein ACP70R_013825 [Stipagrostis hirtigluma subsp. patula]